MKKIAILLSTFLLAQTSFISVQAHPDSLVTSRHRIAQSTDDDTLSPQEVQQTAKNITVRITSASSGGSGVLIAKKGNTYLVLTNAHVARRATQFQIQTPDGQKYTAKPIDGGFDPKYDLALLQFTSQTKYTLADLSDVGSPLAPERAIYSAGFPFDSKDIRITSGQVSQLSDIPFDNGTQIGYTIPTGKKGIRQGMSGGAIIDERGKFIGINTIGVAPILPNYTYNDGSKPLAKLAAKYREANWGVPVYNFLVQVKPDILYGYEFKELKIGKIQRQATLTGYMAKLNDTARKQTVRIENSGGNGSGVIIAKEGNTYYILTAKHVLQNSNTKQKYINPQIITYDQDRHSPTNTIVAENVDLAIVKFTSQSNYPLAQLSEHSPNNDNLIFVGGFPGRENISSPLWQWQLNPGFVTDRETGKSVTQNNLSFSNGYDLYYLNISHGGMSGGPVFDTDGQVIGIHGRAETTDSIILGGSLGISIQSFTGLLDKLQVRPGLLKITKNSPATLNDRDRQTVITAMNNLPQPEAGADGKSWLAYGNQLTRTLQFEKAIVAFDKAITKGEVLNGNYGKMLSLAFLEKYDAAKIAIERAISLVPNDKDRPKYYYFWKYQSAILAKLDKTDEAIKAINEAIRLEPNDSNLQILKASVLTQAKQYAAALAIFTKMNRQPSAYTYANQAAIKFQSGDNNGALADLDRAIKINPNYVDGYLIKSAIKLRLKDFNGALVDIDRAIKINPNYYLAYSSRSEIHLQLKNYQAALADSNKTIELSNVKGFIRADSITTRTFVRAYGIRGNAKVGLQKFSDALADLGRAIELTKANNIDPSFRDGTLLSAYVMQGIAKVGLQKFPEAIADLNRAIELSKVKGIDRSVISEMLPLAYMIRGNAKVELQKFPDGIADLDRAIELTKTNNIDPTLRDSTLLSAYVARGSAKAGLQKFPDAIADLDRAIELSKVKGIDRSVINNTLPSAYIYRGSVKVKLKKLQDGIADLDRGIELAKAIGVDRSVRNIILWLAYYSRGIAKSDIGNKKEAIEDYDRALAINPHFADAYIRRGDAKSDLDNKQGAISDYGNAISLQERSANAINPQYAYAYYSRGKAKSSLGNKKEAIADFDRAIALDPKYAQAYNYRGDAKSALGNKNAAIDDFNRAIAIDPQYDWAYIQRGTAKAQLGNKQGAIADLSKAAELLRQKGRQEDYQWTMGLIAELKGK